MDIHRCRFVPYPPAAINAIAFSHPSPKNGLGKGKGLANLRLAIGRANGDIEIWNPLKGVWSHEITLRGGKDRSIEGLVWTQDPDEVDDERTVTTGKLRLFSIGYSTVVTEWDLELGRPARHSGGNYGEIWSLAAQPRWDETSKKASQDEYTGQNLAVGCADGSIVLLSTEDGDLRFHRTVTRAATKKARVLSLTFQSRHIIIAGCADSTMRIYDIRNGHMLRNMSLGQGPTGGPREVLIWSVKCLKNGTIVSGDSSGEVKFWDGKTYGLVQRVKGHEADILSLEVSADGETVFSGGMDRRTAIYKLMGSGQEERQRRWAKVTHRRFHSHDVKAMAAFETAGMSILVSGGLDTTPIVIPLREFGREYHRTLSHLPQLPCVQSAPKKRLIMSWWDREIAIWRIIRPGNQELPADENAGEGEERNYKLVARIAIKGDENISSASLSEDGSLLAASTLSEVKVFKMRTKKSDEGLRVSKIELPKSLSESGAKLVQFSPDSHWLAVARHDNTSVAARIIHDDQTKGGVTVFPRLMMLKRSSLADSYKAEAGLTGSLGGYDRTISRFAFSSDSRILVAGALSGKLDSWVLEGNEDLQQEPHSVEEDARSDVSSDDDDENDGTNSLVIFGQRWITNPSGSILPKLPSAPLVMSFRPAASDEQQQSAEGAMAVHATRHNPHPHSHDLPTGEDRLFLLTSEHRIYELEVMKGSLSDWSRRNPTSSLPADFKGLRDRAMGSIWDVSDDRERLWLYGSTWLWMFDMSKDLLPPTSESGQDQALQKGVHGPDSKRKRKRDLDEKDTGAGGHIPITEQEVGAGKKFRKITSGPDGSLDVQDVSLDVTREPDSDDDDNVGDEGKALSRLRRGGEGDDGESVGQTDGLTAGALDGPSGPRPVWWSTYKYRPILGIVPMGSDSRDEADDGAGLPEVAIVERPTWELELPPRFYGEQEWVRDL